MSIPARTINDTGCAAGPPIGAADLITWGQNEFCFRIEDDSMAGERINGGDLVYCKRVAAIEDGTLVAVLVAGVGAMVKRMFQKDGMTILQSANADFNELVYPSERVTLLGLVTAHMPTTPAEGGR